MKVFQFIWLETSWKFPRALEDGRRRGKSSPWLTDYTLCGPSPLFDVSWFPGFLGLGWIRSEDSFISLFCSQLSSWAFALTGFVAILLAILWSLELHRHPATSIFHTRKTLRCFLLSSLCRLLFWDRALLCNSARSRTLLLKHPT